MSAATFPSIDQLADGAADAVRQHFDSIFRILFCPPGETLPATFVQYTTRTQHPLGNAAFFWRDASVDEVSSVIQKLVASGYPAAVVLMSDDSPDQAAVVEAAGFGFAEAMPLMTVTPEALTPTELPPGYRFREVQLDEDEAWSETVSVGYGLPVELGRLLGLRRAAEVCAPGTARHFAIEHEGELVATSMLYLHNGLAGIYCVATKAEHRGKGLGAHLTAEPLRLAWQLGYRTGLLQASAMGAPVYRRIGFQTHANMSLFVHMQGS
ncbi:MAG: GNAT family N-acetyltransferase [Phycisphaerales bacterium]